MYAGDLTDAQWEIVAKLMPVGIKSGQPRKWKVRVMLDAIFYVEKTGCQWRQLPKDFPPWKRVYNTYWRWRERGVWQTLVKALREDLRVRAGRQATPSVAIIDSQSVKTASKGGNVDSTRVRKSRAASDTSR